MNTELLRKFAPVLIGLGLIFPIASYFLFMSGGGASLEDRIADPTKEGLAAYPTEDATIVLRGKQLRLSDLREELKSTDPKTLTKNIGLLGAAHDLFSVPELFRLMENSDVMVRGHAAKAVETIFRVSEKNLGNGPLFEPAASAETRKKSLDGMKKIYEGILDKQKKAAASS